MELSHLLPNDRELAYYVKNAPQYHLGNGHMQFSVRRSLASGSRSTLWQVLWAQLKLTDTLFNQIICIHPSLPHAHLLRKGHLQI